MVFFDISVFETTAVIKLCKFTVFSSGSFCQIYRVTDEALIAETMVWPNFFLMNVFFVLKGSKLFIIIKITLNKGLSEPEFYCDLVYQFKKIRGMTDFSDQFRKLIMRYKRIGYNLNVMRQSACLAINSITVDGFAALFYCTPVDRASESMMAPT